MVRVFWLVASFGTTGCMAVQAKAPSNLPSEYVRNDTRLIASLTQSGLVPASESDPTAPLPVRQCETYAQNHCFPIVQAHTDVSKTHCGYCGLHLQRLHHFHGYKAVFCTKNGTNTQEVWYADRGCAQPVGDCDECVKPDEMPLANSKSLTSYEDATCHSECKFTAIGHGAVMTEISASLSWDCIVENDDYKSVAKCIAGKDGDASSVAV